MVDGLIKMLSDYRDASLRKELEGNDEKIMELVRRYFYCG